MLSNRRTAIAALQISALLILVGCLKDESNTTGSGTNPPSTNSPPSISGAPGSGVQVGDSYLFTPTASDPDGDSLTFSISNKPSWATFDPTNGALTGQPLLGDVGIYQSITISVSDGQASASLQAFTITVNQIGTGSATLSWMAPTANDDGSPLTDLAGYRIYYGLAEGNYSSQITIDNPGLTTYVVENLSPNTYYFVATAYNSLGVESVYSNMATKVVIAN